MKTTHTDLFKVAALCVLLSLSACNSASDVETSSSHPEVDKDGDGITDSADNCPSISNATQIDLDNDGLGNPCDLDDDNDGLSDSVELSRGTNPHLADTDNDGIIDSIDVSPLDPTNSSNIDTDYDGVIDTKDNCPTAVNTDQLDNDKDGIGDVCDFDADNDTLNDNLDNCPSTSNIDQLDTDADQQGDECDTDDDGDGLSDTEELAIRTNPLLSDTDGDTLSDSAEISQGTSPTKKDTDNDGINDNKDTYPLDASNTPTTDTDSDGVRDVIDNCPSTENEDQLDTDKDSLGNACDTDDDNDTLSDTEEVNKGTNPLLSDTDNDGSDDAADDFPLDPSKVTTLEKAHHLLLQTSFGPTETLLNNIMSKGVNWWVDSQLNAPSAYDHNGDQHQTHLQRLIQLAVLAEPDTEFFASSVFNQKSASVLTDDYQMSVWWENVLEHPKNTAHGSDQLRQRVAYALSQLLVTSSQDLLTRRAESLAFYYDILAQNAFGNYRQLLSEVSRSPAMGIYLSHQGNSKADLVNATRPDENFAREVIQLFTIGLYELNVNGSANRDNDPNTYPDAGTDLVPSYTQTDVEELAKVMTGWDLSDNPKYGLTSLVKADLSKFMTFIPEQHEDEIAEGGDGNVSLLGTSFALNSGTDGSGLDSALDVLFNHTNTGPYVSRNLIMRLVSSNPSSEYIARVATVFNDNGKGVRGDLKAVTRAILLDPEAREDATNTNKGKIKEPLLAMTQLLRAFHAAPLNGFNNITRENTISDAFWYRQPEKHIGQAALRSPSVFNFYKPDFIPSDPYFSSNNLVAPELQIQTDQQLVNFNNNIYTILQNFEVNKITKIQGISLEEFASQKTVWSNFLMTVNFDKELEVLEMALEGDNNGDFDKIQDTNPDTGLPYKAQAVDALLEHLNQLLLGGTMSTEYKAAFKHYLLSASGTNNNNNFNEAFFTIRDAVRLIATSSKFMVQK